MDEYFDSVVKNLKLEDAEILGILNDKDATSVFKAMRRKELMEISEYPEAAFRRVIGGLLATCLVGYVSTAKEQKLYIKTYGKQALERILEEANIE